MPSAWAVVVDNPLLQRTMMIKELFKRLDTARQSSAGPEHEHDLERVSALLLIEVARADLVIDAAELGAVRKAIAAGSSLASDEIEQLVDEVLEDADATISLHAHVQRINEAFDKSQKIALVERLWRVAYADGDLDRYEEHVIRKLSDLLYLKHRDFMQAKLRVLDDVSGH